MAERKPIIAGNWKMHYTHLEAIQVVQKTSYRLSEKDYENAEVVVCPPFTSLRSVQTVLEADEIPIQLGAQNVYWETKGAYTGEISAEMLAKLTVNYVIVGHSERRQHFGETDDDVNKKAKTVLRHEMNPIVCVGETLEQHEAGETHDFVGSQVRGAFEGVPRTNAGRCVVAYEPIWAIGTGRNATPDDANSVCTMIRSELRSLYGDTADEMRVQYGGSVKPGNIHELMAMSDIDGALVGGASLDPDDFARIVTYDR